MLLVSLAYAYPVAPVHAQSQVSPLYSLQVGAWGDTASVGNVGVRVQIQTSSYNVRTGDSDAFWLGDQLGSGASVRFGYIIHPAHVCLQGTIQGGPADGWLYHVGTVGLDGLLAHCAGSTDNIGPHDARWFWEYFPPGEYFSPKFYYEFGPANSAGMNGTWHDYRIEPNSTNYWSFMFDGHQVAMLPFPVNSSVSPTYVVAEKVAESLPSGRLGPTEFRNLQYLKDRSWRPVSYLIAVIEQSPYGVAVEGANFLIAGSGIPQPPDYAVLWAEGPVVTVLCSSGHTRWWHVHDYYYPYVCKSYTLYSSTGGPFLLELPKKSSWGEAFQSGEGIQFILQKGSTIALPQTIPVMPGEVRIQFEGWSDGYLSPNRTFSSNSNVRLNATYVLQYRLDIFSPGLNWTAVNTGIKPPTAPREFEMAGGWYNAGSTAVFSVPSTIPVQGLWGILGAVYHFQGLYRDPFYNALLTSSNGTIVMSRPYALYVKWSGPDYRVPVVVATALVAIISSASYFRRRHENKSKR